MRAFLFPGQGSQAVGMGAALAEASRAARDVFDEVDEALGQNLFRLMREGPEDELKLTENAQPAIMAHALAVFTALTREGGVSARQGGAVRRRAQPWRIFGAVRGGVVRPCDDRQAAQAARAGDAGGGAGRRRARWRRCSAPMSSWRRRIAEAAAEGEVCTVANDNDPSQVVISGHKGAIERAIEMAKDMGAKRAMLLPVSAPFHCPLMQPAADAMAEALGRDRHRGAGGAALRQCHRRAGRRSRRRSATSWSSRSPAWSAGAKAIANMAAAGVEEFVELGGKVLGPMVKRIAPDAKVTSVVTIDDIEALAKEIA